MSPSVPIILRPGSLSMGHTAQLPLIWRLSIWIAIGAAKDTVRPKGLTIYIFGLTSKYVKDIEIVNGLTGASLTHGEFRDQSIRLASALRRLGLQKGDVVGIVSPNVPEFAIAFLGVAAMGGINTTINCTYTPEEIARQLENSTASALVIHPFLLPVARKAAKLYTGLKYIISMGSAKEDVLSLQDLLKDDGSLYPHNLEVNPAEDLLVLPYSSGTTGLPKGVMLTHRNIVANILQTDNPYDRVMREATICHLYGSMPDDYQETFIGILPMFHIYGMVPCMGISLKLGAKMVTLPEFNPQTYIEAIVKHKPTILHTVPPIIGFLIQHPDVKKEFLENTHTLVCGAAPLGPALIEALLKKFDHGMRFQEGYGMTEASPVTHMSSSETLIPGSCGPCIPNTMSKIVDINNGNILGPDDGEGELCVYGPQVMKGYYRNEKATIETIDEDGWLHTGDIARCDHDQNVFIVDRLKELIKVKGLQVAPAELEDLLRLHPQVSDVAVIGLPDDRSGELPRAYIVPKVADACPDAIAEFVANEVAPHKNWKAE
ncbi:unnamed protein product [Meganyctiphanes norvegica]|uniref:Uncharacterized protein n=1 Tax=Meganyctiphanes norvegica TaxID=48144 RepID=A0AAV2RTX1_MEGNR